VEETERCCGPIGSDMVSSGRDIYRGHFDNKDEELSAFYHELGHALIDEENLS